MKTYPASLLVILAASNPSFAVDVVSNNPFIPADWSPPSERKQVVEAPKEPMNLELRGLDEWNGTKSFYLYDKVKQTGRWTVLNDSSSDVLITALDDSGDSTNITVKFNGRSEKLSLKKPDGKPVEIKTLAVAPPPKAPQTTVLFTDANNGGRPSIPGYNQALPPNDPANIAAIKSFHEARQAGQNGGGTGTITSTASASNIPAPVAIPAPAAQVQPTLPIPETPARRGAPTINNQTDHGNRYDHRGR